uniref:Uncharacterized protein n=1 Tax=Brassica campestris TaxID=3711 RepID=M4CVC1_BRACM
MCEGCLLSFATQKESDCDTYKSLIGISHKDLELLIDDERDLPLALKKEENFVQTTNHLVACKTSNNNTENDSLKQHCSSCRKLLKTKSEKFSKNNTSFFAPAPASSPRVSHNKVSEKESEFKDLDVDRTPSFLKNEVRLDKKSLIDLYMELVEERSASAVGAKKIWQRGKRK